jgi:hypothetical protein
MSKPQSKLPQKKFDPAKIIKKTRSIQEIDDPELGLIRYRSLTFAEIMDVKKYPNPMEASLHLLHRMLAPANPGLTVESIKIMPIDVVTRLMNKLFEKNSFLQVTDPNKAFVGVGLPKGEIKP